MIEHIKVLLLGFSARAFITHNMEAEWGAIDRVSGPTKILWHLFGNLDSQQWCHNKVWPKSLSTAPHLRPGSPYSLAAIWKTSFMVGKYIRKLPWPTLFPFYSMNNDNNDNKKKNQQHFNFYWYEFVQT